MPPFRLNCKGLFLTYPTCDVSPEVAVKNMVDRLGGNLEFACCAREHHADGQLHLHIVAEVKKEVDYTGANCLDWVTGQHGNYQSWKAGFSAGGKRHALKYILKEQYVELYEYGIDARAVLKAMDEKKSGKYANVASKIQSGEWTPEDVMREHPEMYLRDGKKLDEFFERVRKIPKVIDNKEVIVIIGPTNSGKSQWVHDNVADLFCPPIQNAISNWWNGYAGEESVLLDDFSGRMPLEDFLRLLQKWPEALPTKGAHVRVTARQFFITTQEHPWTWYSWEKRLGQRAALQRRITSVMEIGPDYSLVPVRANFWDEFIFVPQGD